jgi:hypothetical protein
MRRPRGCFGPRIWEPVQLPGAPERLQIDYGAPAVMAGAAVVVGQEIITPFPNTPSFEAPAGATHVWTSTDGVTWHGTRIEGQASFLSPASVHGIEHGSERLLFLSVMTGTPDSEDMDEFTLYRSSDAGLSWSPTDISRLSWLPGQVLRIADVWEDDDRLVAGVSISGPLPSDPDASIPEALFSEDGGLTWEAGRCPVRDRPAPLDCDEPDPAGRLRYRRDQVSLDGGRTWQTPAFDPPHGGQDAPPQFESLTELPDGGWLATLQTNIVYYGRAFAARSNDGLSWQLVVPQRPENVAPEATMSKPIRLGDSWLVAYTVGAWDGPPSSAELFLLDANASTTHAIAGSRRERYAYGQPVVVGDTAVMLEGEQRHTRTSILRVRLR